MQAPRHDRSIAVYTDVYVRSAIAEEFHPTRTGKFESVGFCEHGHFGNGNFHIICPQARQGICIPVLVGFIPDGFKSFKLPNIRIMR